jgi:hypothetical protein
MKRKWWKNESEEIGKARNPCYHVLSLQLTAEVAKDYRVFSSSHLSCQLTSTGQPLALLWHTCCVVVALVSSYKLLTLTVVGCYITHPLSPCIHPLPSLTLQRSGGRSMVVLGECNAISTIAGVVLTLCNEGGLASPLPPLLLHSAPLRQWNLKVEFPFWAKREVTCSEFFCGFFCRCCVMSKRTLWAAEVVCILS